MTRIKKNDTVVVTTGKDKGKKGKVLRVFPELGRVLIEGLNVKKTHQKKGKSGKKGQMIEKSFPMHISNVMVVDPKGGKATRIRYSVVGGKKERVASKSGSVIN